MKKVMEIAPLQKLRILKKIILTIGGERYALILIDDSRNNLEIADTLVDELRKTFPNAMKQDISFGLSSSPNVNLKLKAGISWVMPESQEIPTKGWRMVYENFRGSSKDYFRI